MEAGNRCGDWNVPETINRKIVDHISDINLPYTEHAYANLMKEGIEKEYTFITGSPMLEVLNANNDKIEASKVLEDMGLEKGKYIVVSSHREENIDIKKNFDQLMPALNDIAEKYQVPVIFSTHPRTQKRFDANGFKPHPHQGMHFKGERHHEPWEWTLGYETIYSLVIENDTTATCMYVNGEMIEILPKTKCIGKMLLLVEEMHRLHVNTWKNFPWCDYMYKGTELEKK